MKILFLHQFNLNLAGGSGVYLRAMAHSIRQMGHELRVVSALYPDRYGCTTDQLPFDFTLTFGPEKRDGEKTLDELDNHELNSMSCRLAEQLSKEFLETGQPDLILVNHISILANTAHLLKQHCGIPYRIISYGTDTKLLLRDQRYRRLFQHAAAQADRIFAISGFVAKEVEETIPGTRLEVMGGAVDTACFYPPESPRAPSGTLLYIGRLVTEKGLWPLLEAFQMQKTASTLLVAGEGPLMEPVRTLIQTNGLEERIKLLGYLPPRCLRPLLLESDLLIVPSIWEEPLGLVVLEGLACGVPVVATSVGGVPEMIQDGVNGQLVSPNDAVALANAIDGILGNPEKFQTLRNNALREPVPSYRDLAIRAIQ